VNAFKQELMNIIIDCPRDEHSDEMILFMVKRALDYRRMKLKLGNPQESFTLLKNFMIPSDEKIYKSMEYPEYLKSFVWEIIRDYKLFVSNYKCEACECYENLDVHHLTYKYRGSEHKHLKTLRVLCRDCHSLAHGKPN